MIDLGVNHLRVTTEDLCQIAATRSRVAGATEFTVHRPQVRWWHRWLGVLPARVVVEVREMRD